MFIWKKHEISISFLIFPDVLIIFKPRLSGWWLTYPSEKYEFVNGKDYPIYEMEHKIRVWNHQSVIINHYQWLTRINHQPVILGRSQKSTSHHQGLPSRVEKNHMGSHGQITCWTKFTIVYPMKYQHIVVGCVSNMNILSGWWCNVPILKSMSLSMGRMASHIWNGK